MQVVAGLRSFFQFVSTSEKRFFGFFVCLLVLFACLLLLLLFFSFFTLSHFSTALPEKWSRVWCVCLFVCLLLFFVDRREVMQKHLLTTGVMRGTCFLITDYFSPTAEVSHILGKGNLVSYQRKFLLIEFLTSEVLFSYKEGKICFTIS